MDELESLLKNALVIVQRLKDQKPDDGTVIAEFGFGNGDTIRENMMVILMDWLHDVLNNICYASKRPYPPATHKRFWRCVDRMIRKYLSGYGEYIQTENDKQKGVISRGMVKISEVQAVGMAAFSLAAKAFGFDEECDPELPEIAKLAAGGASLPQLVEIERVMWEHEKFDACSPEITDHLDAEEEKEQDAYIKYVEKGGE
jgi:hypothetical protein